MKQYSTLEQFAGRCLRRAGIEEFRILLGDLPGDMMCGWSAALKVLLVARNQPARQVRSSIQAVFERFAVAPPGGV